MIIECIEKVFRDKVIWNNGTVSPFVVKTDRRKNIDVLV